MDVFENETIFKAMAILCSSIAMANYTLNREHQDRFDTKLDEINTKLDLLLERSKGNG